jgi:hypothetical protein
LEFFADGNNLGGDSAKNVRGEKEMSYASGSTGPANAALKVAAVIAMKFVSRQINFWATVRVSEASGTEDP